MDPCRFRAERVHGAIASLALSFTAINSARHARMGLVGLDLSLQLLASTRGDTQLLAWAAELNQQFEKEHHQGWAGSKSTAGVFLACSPGVRIIITGPAWTLCVPTRRYTLFQLSAFQDQAKPSVLD